jgi:hypothetical protein
MKQTPERKNLSFRTVTRNSQGWNLWVQSLSAAYLYHLWIILGRIAKKIQKDFTVPFKKNKNSSQFYRMGRTVNRRWSNFIKPWRNRLQFQDLIEAFILVLLALLPVLKNGYWVTFALVLFMLYHGIKAPRSTYGLICLIGLFLTAALLSPGYRDSLAGLAEWIMD